MSSDQSSVMVSGHTILVRSEAATVDARSTAQHAHAAARVAHEIVRFLTVCIVRLPLMGRPFGG